MQAALLASALFAADSQGVPRAELDAAVKAYHEAHIATMNLARAEAKRALAIALRRPAKDSGDAAVRIQANIEAIDREMADAKKTGGIVPHFGYQAMKVGQIGKMYYRGHIFGPFNVQANGDLRAKDDSWHDFPVKARVREIMVATTLHVAYGLGFRLPPPIATVHTVSRHQEPPPMSHPGSAPLSSSVNKALNILMIVLAVGAASLFACCGGFVLLVMMFGRREDDFRREVVREGGRPRQASPAASVNPQSKIPPHMTREAISKRQDEWLREQDEKARKFFKLPD